MFSNGPAETTDFLAQVDALVQQRQFDQALELAFERHLRLQGDVEARIALCKIWMKMGKLARVDEILKDMEKRIADWSRIYVAMGDICRDSGLQKEAARFYDRYASINPQGAGHLAFTAKPELIARTGQQISPSDEDHYEDIAEIAPDFYTLTLAELYLRQHQPEMARNVLREILRRNPDNTEAAQRLREIEAPSGPLKTEKPQVNAKILDELTRWIGNIHRLRDYAT